MALCGDISGAGGYIEGLNTHGNLICNRKFTIRNGIIFKGEKNEYYRRNGKNKRERRISRILLQIVRHDKNNDTGAVKQARNDERCARVGGIEGSTDNVERNIQHKETAVLFAVYEHNRNNRRSGTEQNLHGIFL